MNAQIQSFTSNATYGLVVDETSGQATDCGCKDRQYRHRQCKHMKAFDAEVQKAATFILLQERVKTIEAQTSDVLQTRRIHRDLMYTPY